MTADLMSAVGKRVPRVDAAEKVTGVARYTSDIQLPGMLYGKLKRSPHAHARVVKVDTSRAAQLPGVKAVLTWDDVPHVPHAGQPQPRAGSLAADQFVLADTARFRGDGVAAVAATSPEIAEEALDLIDVIYETLPSVFEADAAMAPGAPLIHNTERNLVMPPAIIALGDVAKGFAEADFIFEGRYETSRHVPAFMEPYVCICRPEPGGRLTIWSSTQAPFMVRGSISEVLGIPLSQIRVITEHMGGGFGGKQDLYQLEYLTVLLARRTGRPVKMEYTREETFVAGRSRHPVIVELKQGVKRDGTLTARQARFIANSGAYASHGPGITWVGSQMLGGLHKCPNVYIEGLCVYTNAPIAGAFRGYGAPQAYFALETQMDEIAQALHLDPVELRLKNAYQPGDIGPAGTPFLDTHLPDCLRRGAELIGWEERRPAASDPGVVKRGLGVACQLHAATSYPDTREVASVVVAINEDGTVQLRTGASDLGTGAKTVIAQIVAEALGVCYEDIKVVAGDTDSTPYDLGAYASRTTFIVGGAAQRAAVEARAQILAIAAARLGVEVGRLDASEGVIRVAGEPGRMLTFREVMQPVRGDTPPIIMGQGGFAPRNDYSFAVQFAEVEVDTETGQTRVLRIASVHDVGRAINPAGAEGQVEGGLHQGLGYALLEDLVVDPATGRTLNANFVDYKLLTAQDMPEMLVDFIESGDPLGPFGAKGLAEDPVCPTAPAITNAIYNAIGVRIKKLPASAEAVLAALQAE
ncbi:MAG TPA: molybdopterin cofactor-binding domain-containing protein [Anaerolineae bacterium]